MKTSANILQTPVYFCKDFTFHLSQSLSSTNWVAKISNYTWTMAPWAQLSPKCVMDGLELCGSQKGFRCAEPQLCLVPSPVLVSRGAELSSCPCWKEGGGIYPAENKCPDAGSCVGMVWWRHFSIWIPQELWCLVDGSWKRKGRAGGWFYLPGMCISYTYLQGVFSPWHSKATHYLWNSTHCQYFWAV